MVMPQIRETFDSRGILYRWVGVGMGVMLCCLAGFAVMGEDAHANEMTASVIIGTIDQEKAFQGHPAYTELVALQQSFAEAQAGEDVELQQQVLVQLQQKQQEASTRFHQDMMQAMPHVAQASKVDLVAGQVLSTGANAQTKDVTPQLIQAFSGDSQAAGTPPIPVEGEGEKIRVGTYDPQAVFQQHPRHQELADVIETYQQAEAEGDMETMQAARINYERIYNELTQSFQQSAAQSIPAIAASSDVEAFVVQLLWISERIEVVDFSSQLARAIREMLQGGNGTQEQAPALPDLR